MIVGSILAVLTAVVLLVLGLVQSNEALFYSSIVTSAIAAVALVVGVRQYPAGRLPDADVDLRPARPGRLTAHPVGRIGVPRSPRLDGAGVNLTDLDRALLAWADDDIPADEPTAQIVTGEAAAKVSRLRAEVIVVDDRPRYHVPECLHLLGRSGQRLSVREAIRLGFTPCSLCEPVTALLATG